MRRQKLHGRSIAWQRGVRGHKRNIETAMEIDKGDEIVKRELRVGLVIAQVRPNSSKRREIFKVGGRIIG